MSEELNLQIPQKRIGKLVEFIREWAAKEEAKGVTGDPPVCRGGIDQPNVVTPAYLTRIQEVLQEGDSVTCYNPSGVRLWMVKVPTTTKIALELSGSAELVQQLRQTLVPLKGMKKVIVSILNKHHKSLDDLKRAKYFQIKNGSYMPLSIDYLGKPCADTDTYSVAHNTVQEGDVMADPDMEFVDVDGQWLAATFQNDFVGKFQREVKCEDDQLVVPREMRQKEIQHFADGLWAKNLRQGFLEGELYGADSELISRIEDGKCITAAGEPCPPLKKGR